MASNSSPDLLDSVGAPSGVHFSVDFDPSRADLKPSVLLLTQNMGGIKASLGARLDADGAPLKRPRKSAAELTSDGSSTFFSKSTLLAAASYIHVTDEVDVEDSIPLVVRQQVAEFLADLRQWIHRLSYVSVAARAAEAAENVSGAPISAANGRSSSSPPNSGPAANVDAYMQTYTPSARPPLIDVVVLHFQEIGGKYKNRRFNEYFKEQIRTTLLPEAGWTSGLLMDERDSGGAESSSSYCRRATTLEEEEEEEEGEEVPALDDGDCNHIGNADGHDGGGADVYRVSDASNHGVGSVAEANNNADAFFTAIGSIVFLSPRVMGIASCLSVPHRTYIPIVDDPLTYAGEAGRLFHSGKFSEAGCSRKGFLLISLRLGTVPLNVCNVHLFHDDDNREALASSPSRYAARRVRAIKEAIAECSAVVDLSEPFFVFGDLNVRVDGKSLLGWVEEKWRITVRPEKKRLRCPERFWGLFSDPAVLQELRLRFDMEPQHLMDEVASLSGVELAEMPIQFAPTYSRVPYRTCTSAATVTTDAVTVRDAAATEDSQRDMLASKGFAAREGLMCAAEQEPLGGIAATALPPARSSSYVPPKRPTASIRRDNFCRSRLPAWCDRVFFNVAGFEWIAGERARPTMPKPQSASPVPSDTPAPAPTPAPAAAAASGTGLRKSANRRDQSNRCIYAAIDLIHTDHDGVFLLF